MKELLEKEIETIKEKIQKVYDNPNYTTISGELTNAGMSYVNYFKGKISGLKQAIKLLERGN